mmetsp:Transcript_87117/g.269721  ORF Transcript_87117/g.269721 Transcript_87117/m.269721 type:complete len:580 (-) Transcript_87117:66-1805(-)
MVAASGLEGRRRPVRKLPRVQAPVLRKSAPAQPAPEAEDVGSTGGKSAAALQKRRAAAGTDGEEGKDAPTREQGDGDAEAAGADGPAADSAGRKPVARAPEALFQTNTTFAKLGLARWLVEGCEKLGMRYPTAIQAMCIPPVLAGKNVVGNSKTGSGKTACYCLPTLHHLSKDPYGVFALVITPVRELASQVAENFGALGRGIGVEVLEVVGGREMLYQGRMIAERRHVIVATPGRLADLFRGDADLAKAFRNLRFCVLDEADRLLTQAFEDSLPEILAVLPKTRQTLLFSATITKSIEKLRSRLVADGKELLLLDANPRDESLDTLTQQYVFVPQTVQVCYLHYLLKEHFANDSCILFAPTIKVCQLLTTTLEILEFPVTGLHSLQSQRRRQSCLNKFRAGRCTILVATNVAGRGLDIPKVSVVINVGLPRNTDDYVHRAGRTARAGRPGLVVSLMTERDVSRVHRIEDRIGKQLELRKTDEEDAIKLLSKTTKAQQRAELLLSEVGFEERIEERLEERKKAGEAKRKRSADAQAAAAGAPPAPPEEDPADAPPEPAPRRPRRRRRARAGGGVDAGAE